MQQTILILGSTGRVGRHVGLAFQKAGWGVRRFKRGQDNLAAAADGADVIFFGWNPGYERWAQEYEAQLRQVLDVAQASGATVLFPGNVYVFGAGSAEMMGQNSPHAAQNPLGKIRVRMEAMLKASPVQTIVLRAGDYLDTEPSGNWFDKIMVAKAAKGQFAYPGARDVPHAFAYIPDLAECFVQLAERRAALGAHEDLPFAGYTLTGQQLCDAVEEALGHPLRIKGVPWGLLKVLGLVMPMMRNLGEMRYLWNMPHQLDHKPLRDLLGEVPHTPLDQAMMQATRHLGQGVKAMSVQTKARRPVAGQ